MQENYEPYGEEWKKEMMRMKKPELVDLIKSLLQNMTQKDRIASSN